MKIYNSLSGSKQVFKPITQKKINMYVCGMTVYDDCHIGHARTFLTFDLFLRFFNFLGFEVNYVRNITDIEDKIIEKAKNEKVNYDDISSRFIESMHEDFKKLNLLSPNLEPKASEHIGEIVSMIENLNELEIERNPNLTCLKVSQKQLDNNVSSWKIDSNLKLVLNCN